MLTRGQRNVLHFMSYARWVWLGLGFLFIALAGLQIWVVPEADWLSQGLHVFAYVVISLTQFGMAAITFQWRAIFRPHMEEPADARPE